MVWIRDVWQKDALENEDSMLMQRKTPPLLTAAALAGALLVMMAPGAAWSQDAAPEPEAPTPIKLAEPAPEAAAAEPTAAEPAPEEPVAAEPSAAPAPQAASADTRNADVYWGKKRDLSVVQKRLFTKDGRLEFTVFGGLIPNDPFLTYFPVGGRINYYFVESLSVEVAGAYTGSGVQSETDLKGFLKNNTNIQANTDLLDQQIWRANTMVVWSPFYGKMALLDDYLSHFDINLAAGLGVVQTESPTPERDGFETELKPEGALGAGFRFFLTDWFALRLDYRQGIFQKVGGGVSTPSELTLGLSFFTGG